MRGRHGPLGGRVCGVVDRNWAGSKAGNPQSFTNNTLRPVRCRVSSGVTRVRVRVRRRQRRRPAVAFAVVVVFVGRPPSPNVGRGGVGQGQGSAGGGRYLLCAAGGIAASGDRQRRDAQAGGGQQGCAGLSATGGRGGGRGRMQGETARALVQRQTHARQPSAVVRVPPGQAQRIAARAPSRRAPAHSGASTVGGRRSSD